MNNLRIGRRQLGHGKPVYVIAEAGSNHDGNLQQAIELIDVAAEAGADAVKFQLFKADRLYPRAAGESDYLKQPRPIYDIIKDMELPEQWIPALAGHSRNRRIEFLVSPFDERGADVLEDTVNAYKIASYEMTHEPLVRHIAQKGKPIIMSTGTATLDEVIRSVAIVKGEGNHDIVVLQCTACYPTPIADANLRAMETIRQATNCLVGLSDHTRDAVVAPIAATALGACVIEKHFTLSNSLPGPDHPFALEPDELRLMVRSVRAAEAALGHGRKEPLSVERELHAFARRTVFVTRNVEAGEVLTRDNTAVLRAGKMGSGVAPAQYEEILGRRTQRRIEAQRPLQLDDLA